MNSEEFEFSLGQTVKNPYTGVTGRVVTRCQYLTGCNRYSIQPKGLNKETNQPWEAIGFDEEELVAIDNKGRVGKREDGGPAAPPPAKHKVGV